MPRQADLKRIASGALIAFCLRAAADGAFDATNEAVGFLTNGFVTPVHQLVTPAGVQVVLPGLRPYALALSPDGKLLVTSGLNQELVVLDPASGKTLQRVRLPMTPAEMATNLDSEDRPQLSFTGLTFSPDGTRIFLANVQGNIKVFSVDASHQVAPLTSFLLPPVNAPGHTNEIPTGLAVSSDGKKLYVALNLSNRAAELDAVTGAILRTWNVGVAPYSVVLAGNKLYVSNTGGRRPDASSITGPSGDGTRVRVDDRSIANEGSVSAIDLAQNQQSEILTGLRPGAMALSPDGRWLVVANSGSDTLGVIDPTLDKVVDAISARRSAADLFGAQPNALAFDPSGQRLYVCNGTQNAVAVFQFTSVSRFLGLFPRHRFKIGQSQWLGLIPAGWFPGSIVYDSTRSALYVANLKSLPPQPERARIGKGPGFNTRQFTGSLSLVPLPTDAQLAVQTQQALDNMRYPLLAQAALPPRPAQPAQPVPERAGEPSVFQHVLYIIKENRTYDQVLGDLTQANGNGNLCTFGRQVTPNQHKLVQTFALLDNAYCCGILSADGHQWADAGMVTEYVERQFGSWPRSYPSGGFGDAGRDALAYSPAGFIWNNALAHGKSVVDFGEFTSAEKRWKDPRRKGEPGFLDCYQDFITGSNAILYSCEPDIEALRPYMATNIIGWDLSVPDIWRAAQFIARLKEYEQSGNLPNLVILWLPNDHTSGTKPGFPTPAAHVADNDLAMGQVIEALSHSAFWSNTCCFAIEDDPQNGWDHVSGYRTTAYVASAYTRRGAVVSTQYNQTSLLRTMELMLGLPPMNQMDATATPMFDCFTNVPDFTAFDAVTNQVPLDTMNPGPKSIADAVLRQDAYVSARLRFDREDECPEDVLNRILWHAMKGSQAEYPLWAVKSVPDDD